LALELGEITPWSDGALVAERFYDRRVFLAGDATHVMSPAGGFAMNVGLADAHNLAWKLAAVLAGWAAPALLDSYQAERAPISRLMTKQMAINLSFFSSAVKAAAGFPAPSQPPAQLPLARPDSFREHGLVFGHAYASAIIVPDGTDSVQVKNPVTDYVPNARPGSRAPHVWLERGGTLITTLDLFGSGLVILAGALGRHWCVAAREFAEQQGIPLACYTIGLDGDYNSAHNLWQAAYGVADDGAVLVRPDGYIAWRSHSGSRDPQCQMNRAMSAAIGRMPEPLALP